MKHHTRTYLRALAALTVLAPSVYTVRAAVETWTTGAGTSSLSASSNWSGTNATPLSGDSWVFGATTGATTLNNDLTANLTVAGITFNAGTNTTVSAAAVGGVSALTLTSTTGMIVGQSISGTGISQGTTVTGFDAATNVVQLSKPTTSSIAAAAAIGYNGAAYTLTGTAITLGSSGILLNSGSANQVINLDMGLTAATSISTTANSLTLNGVISGNVDVNFTASVLGTITLTQANSYTGNTRINGSGGGGAGAVSIDAFNRLGTGTTINLGASSTVGILRYTGSGETTDKVINLNGVTANATLDQSGTGLLQFTSNLTATGLGNKTLILQGSTAGTGEIAGSIVNSTGFATSLTKQGTGTWTLSGANTYSGTTSVSAGTLVLNGTNTSAGATTLSGGTLSLGNAANGGLASGLLSLNGGTLQSSNVSARSLSNALAIGADFTIGGTGDLAFTDTTTGVALSATRTLTVNNTSTSFAQTFSSTGGLTKAGTGTLTLSGANTYTGTTIVNAGTLVLNGTNSLTGATTVNAGTLKLDYATNNTSKLGDTGILALNGGTLELSGGSHTEVVTSTTLNTGVTFIKQTNSGTAKLQMGAITFTAGAIDFSADSIATTTTSNQASGILSTRATVAGANFATGDSATTNHNVVALTTYTALPNSGALTANTNYQLVGSGSISTSTGATSETLKITTNGTSQAFAVGGNKLTMGAILFAGANDYSITTSGTGSIVPTILHNYGTSGATLSLGTLGGALTQFGTGKTLLTQAATTDNTLAINGGSVQFSDNLQIGTNATVRAITLNNGTLIANTSGGSIALDNAGTFSRTVSLGAGGGTINVAPGATTNALTVSGVVSGTGSLTKLGTGTLNLSAINTYTGATTVNAGKLTIASGGTINSTSGVSIGAGEFNYTSATALSKTVSFSGTGGTLRGTGTISSAVAITSGNTVAAGADAATLGTLTFSGGLTGTTGSIFSFKLNSGTVSGGIGSSDLFAVNGTAALGSATLSLTDLGSTALTNGETFTLLTASTSISGTFLNLANGSAIHVGNTDYTLNYLANTVTLTASAIPEPATYAALAGLGILGFAVYRRRQAS